MLYSFTIHNYYIVLKSGLSVHSSAIVGSLACLKNRRFVITVKFRCYKFTMCIILSIYCYYYYYYFKLHLFLLHYFHFRCSCLLFFNFHFFICTYVAYVDIFDMGIVAWNKRDGCGWMDYSKVAVLVLFLQIGKKSRVPRSRSAENLVYWFLLQGLLFCKKS